jgi:uncharacterized protein (DUF433 family)
MMLPMPETETYTPAEISAVISLPLRAVHKAIEYKLIRPAVVRDGRSSQRMLSQSHAVYLRLEATGLKSLPLAERREVARAIERDPRVDAFSIRIGGAILIQCKTARREVAAGLRRLALATRMVESDPQIMRGTPVYKGTRIPVHAVADMLSQGASVDEILEGYPGLTREKIELAPMYVKAYPRRGRPAVRPWIKQNPRRVSRRRLAIG